MTSNKTYYKTNVMLSAFTISWLNITSKSPKPPQKVLSGISLAFNFPVNGRVRKFFWPKTICSPREIIPQNFSSLELTISKELGKKQTKIQTDR